MKIFVLGNINVGKSIVVEKLKLIFNNYDVFQIDQYRKLYGDGTIEKEELLRSKFVEDVIKTKNAIIEFSGGGKIKELLFTQLQNKFNIVLHVQEELEVCLGRIFEKTFSDIPYPKFDESLEDTIIRLHKEMVVDNGIEREYSNNCLYYKVISSNEEIPTIIKSHYENLVEISKYFATKKVDIFSYGSLGRNELKITSDIDLYCYSDMKFENLYQDIVKKFESKFEVSKNLNKICLRDNKLLFEITTINNLKDAEIFYYHSNILIPENTIIVNNYDDTLLLKLNALLKEFSYSLTDEIKKTLERLNYYLDSLLDCANKQDYYRFFFHNNIVIHEFIKLKSIFCGNCKYLYLPKMVSDFVETETLNKLVFDFDKDMTGHAKKVKELVDSFLIEFEEQNNK